MDDEITQPDAGPAPPQDGDDLTGALAALGESRLESERRERKKADRSHANRRLSAPQDRRDRRGVEERERRRKDRGADDETDRDDESERRGLRRRKAVRTVNPMPRVGPRHRAKPD